jgi:membrane protein DedA with SNARE-associated domain
MFDSIANAVSGSPWTYLLIVGVCTFDALLPLFPSETVVVTAAVLGSRGRLNVELVAVCAAAGALLGDNSAYWAGRSALRRLVDRTMRSEKSQRRLEWARDQLKERGGWIIIVARFIPGGRTATTYVSGTLEMPWNSKFLPFDAIAAVAWALFATGLGYFGGAAFEHNLWLPVLIATGVSLIVAAGGELVRRKVLDRGARSGPKNRSAASESWR